MLEDKVVCPYCDREFVKKRRDQITCGDIDCQRKRNAEVKKLNKGKPKTKFIEDGDARKCLSCGCWFTPDSGNQKYCKRRSCYLDRRRQQKADSNEKLEERKKQRILAEARIESNIPDVTEQDKLLVTVAEVASEVESKASRQPVINNFDLAEIVQSVKVANRRIEVLEERIKEMDIVIANISQGKVKNQNGGWESRMK